MLWRMDLNASSISESPAISSVLGWKILWSFLFLYCKSNIVWILNFFKSLNRYFNLLLIIIGLVLISYNSGLKRFKTSILYRLTYLSEDFDWRYKAIQWIFQDFVLHLFHIYKNNCILAYLLKFQNPSLHHRSRSLNNHQSFEYTTLYL